MNSQLHQVVLTIQNACLITDERLFHQCVSYIFRWLSKDRRCTKWQLETRQRRMGVLPSMLSTKQTGTVGGNQEKGRIMNYLADKN